MIGVMLSGKQGSGKSSVQKLLCERWEGRGVNHRAHAINFADVLREMHNAVISILEKYVPPRGIVKDGNLLQVLGTEWGRRTLGPDIWVNCLESKVQQIYSASSFLNNETLIVIGDCRFTNEFVAFPETLRVRLNCAEEIRKDRCEHWRIEVNHPSEIDLDSYVERDLFDLVADSGALTCAEIVKLIEDEFK